MTHTSRATAQTENGRQARRGERRPYQPSLSLVGATARTGYDPALLAREIAKESVNVEVLQVEGNSMSDALLRDGDCVLLQRTGRQGRESIESGELVAVRVDGELRLRRYHADGQRVRLQSENRTLPAEVLPRGEVEVLGRVVAILRQHV